MPGASRAGLSLVVWSERTVSRGAVRASVGFYAQREKSGQAKPGIQDGEWKLQTVLELINVELKTAMPWWSAASPW